MKIIKWLDEHLEEIFISLFSLIMVVVIAIQVFMRYVLENSLSWSEELARYCFIWLVYVGISFGVKKNRHMSVDVLSLALKGKWKIGLSIVANLLFLGFAIFVILNGYEISMKLLTWGQKSPALHIPIGLVYLAGPVGMGLASIRLIQQIFQQFRRIVEKEAVQ